MTQDNSDTVPDDYATLKDFATDPQVDVMSELERAFAPAQRAWRKRALMQRGDMEAAHGVLCLADEAICAVLTSDDGLLDHKLHGLDALCAGRPLLMELAACRIQRLVDTELFRLHVGSSTRRSRLAHRLCQVAASHLPAGSPR